MERIVLEQRVNGEGILQLSVPLGASEAGRDVRVTVESIDSVKEMSPEEWRAGILATAGSWQGEFESLPEGDFEEREPLP